jgi:hypothetical protein
MTGEILGQDDGLTLGKITVFRTLLYLDWTVGKEFGQDDELTWVGKVTYEGQSPMRDIIADKMVRHSTDLIRLSAVGYVVHKEDHNARVAQR